MNLTVRKNRTTTTSPRRTRRGSVTQSWLQRRNPSPRQVKRMVKRLHRRGFRTHINGVDVWPFYMVVEAVENRPVAEQRSRIDSSRMTLTRPVGMTVVLVEDHCCSLVTNEFVGRPMRRLVRHNRIGGDGKHWQGGWRGSTIGG